MAGIKRATAVKIESLKQQQQLSRLWSGAEKS